MNKFDLIRFDDTTYRIILLEGQRAFVVNCGVKRMPYWVDLEKTQFSLEKNPMVKGLPFDELSEEHKTVALRRYTMIAPILAVCENERKRSEMIDMVSVENKVSRQTIRNYLWRFLAYQDIGALAPKQQTNEERGLTSDEKNIRWALNKFYYTQRQYSLSEAYAKMLKEKYCYNDGKLCDKYPSFYQFRYFYRKTKSIQKYYISRNGIKDYQRNNRPLLGDGVQEFAPAVGVGMLDSTICDIYLIDDTGKVVGRPVLTACVDAFSGFCYGYFLGWEGGTYSLRGMMLNVVSDKKKWCEERGVFIENGEWHTDRMPGVLVTDMGSEYKSETFSQIVELGVRLITLPPYRPELKGRVERFFSLIQSLYKAQLKGKGVIEPDYQERGAHDYRKDACLTIGEFEKIVLHCILYYNNKRIIDFPFSEKMLSDGVKPYARDIFEWGVQQIGANLISVTSTKLIKVLLPRATGKFTRRGLQVNGLRYGNGEYAERFLQGGNALVAYNPDDVTEVWLIEKGQYIPFPLIESRFNGKSLEGTKSICSEAQKRVQSASVDNLQAKIDLAGQIQAIVNQSGEGGVGIKNIRQTRAREQAKNHIDYVKESRK